MSTIYINWSEHKVTNEEGLQEKIDDLMQERDTQRNFEDYIDEQYCASSILDMINEDGWDNTMDRLREEWADDLRADAEREILMDWDSFNTDEDWD